MTDAVFVLSDGSRLSAHRLVLAAGSPVFQAMFYGPLRQAPNVDIPVPDVEAGAFCALVRYLYTDDVKTDLHNVGSLFQAADKYNVREVETVCRHYLERLKANLSTGKALKVLSQALLCKADDLVAECLKVIAGDAPRQLASEDWLALSLEGLSLVLSADTLALPEMNILDAARRWARVKCREQDLSVTPENEAAVLGKSLSLVRFPLMSPAELCSLVAEGFLTKEVVGESTAEQRRNADVIPRLRQLGLYNRDDELCTNITKLLDLEAALEGDLAALEKSLSAGLPMADVRTRSGQTFLCTVLDQGNVEAARLLLDHEQGAARLLPALFEAANGGDIKSLKTCLEAGVPVDNRDHMGQTALLHFFKASGRGNAEVVKTLLEAGACVNAADYKGWTPLHGASTWGRSAVVRALLEAGAHVNAVEDKWGDTPLHRAAMYGHTEAARLLLEAGASRSLKNDGGLTPLDGARAYCSWSSRARRDGKAAIACLLESGDLGAASTYCDWDWE